MFTILVDALVTGLPVVATYAGIYLLFRILNDFDLTVDGSFTLGAAVSATLTVQGWNPALSIAAAVLVGAGAGLVTTTLHLVLRIPVLLAGLLMSLALYSVNLRIMGAPSVGLLNAGTLLSGFDDWSGDAKDAVTIAVLGAVAVVTLAALGAFLRTEPGLALRATGMNPIGARAQGVDQRVTVGLALALANGLAALGGALTAQNQGFADVNMGVGTLIAGAGALLLGELLLRPTAATVGRAMVAVLIGTVVYRMILVGALRYGLPATDLKAVTALTLVLAVLAQRLGSNLGGASAALRRVLPARPAVRRNPAA
jgi:putative ABC transport system permease protein